MRTPGRALLFALAAGLAAAPAPAQQPSRPPARPSAAVPAKPEPAKPEAPEPPASSAQPQNDAPPYEADLLRLADMLGALHHLRAVCSAADAALWRDRMNQLLEAEATTSTRRARLAGAFNAGYQTYRRSYSTCTPAAQYVIRRFLAESAELARNVAARYGN